MNRALEGLRVIDLSRVMAAPFATQMLSDLGADVVKIEALGGDDTRVWGSHYFRAANRGKRSIAVNLKDGRGQDLVQRLAGDADVFVENFKVGDLTRYGLDYAALSALNPRLIFLSVSGFGQTGPRRDQPGYDTIIQGLSGIMTLCGEPDRPPARAGLPIVDVSSGLVGAIGILAALRERDRSGMGQHIDISLFDVAAMMLVDAGQDYLDHGHVQSRLGGINRNFAPAQPFATRDGWVTLAVATDDQFRRMSAAMELPGLLADPRFVDNAGRVKNRQALADAMAPRFAARTSAQWSDAFESHKVPLSPIRDIAEALADPQGDERNLIWTDADGLRLLANPLQHMSRTPAASQGAPPQLGADSRTILAERLEMSEAEIDGLVAAGVVGA